MEYSDYPHLNKLVEKIFSVNNEFDLRRDFYDLIRSLAATAEVEQALEAIRISLKSGNTPDGLKISEASVVLAQSQHCALVFVCHAESDKKSIYYPSDRQIVVNYAGSPVSLRVFNPPKNGLAPYFQKGEVLTLVREITLQKRDAEVFDNISEVVDFYSSSTSSYLALVDLRPSPWPLRWDFDPITLDARGSTIGDRRLSFVRAIIDLYGHLASQTESSSEYAETLDPLTRHDHHIIRWAAIQAIGRIDIDKAMPALERSKLDAHHEIRSAATKLLDRM